MLPMVFTTEALKTEFFNKDFKSLLNTLQGGEIGTLCMNHQILFMIGIRYFNSSEQKSDKKN